MYCYVIELGSVSKKKVILSHKLYFTAHLFYVLLQFGVFVS